jgi:predicted RNase H-like HicB family nuclease
MEGPYLVRAQWDAEASVWVASSDDVPGLATESSILEELNEKLQTLVPELLAANARMPTGGQIIVELLARRLTAATAIAS